MCGIGRGVFSRYPKPLCRGVFYIGSDWEDTDLVVVNSAFLREEHLD